MTPWLTVLGIYFFAAGVIPTTHGAFTAAVFEHRYSKDLKTLTPREAVSTTIPFFEKAATEASKRNVDIIVFPEYGLFDYWGSREYLRSYAQEIPDPTKGTRNPCLEQNEGTFILNAFSCLARKHKMYLVGNMLDLQPCAIDSQSCSADGMCDSKCYEDGVHVFNTDIAFDREGNLIAKYHKLHLYFEPLDTPEPEYVTFNTSFGTFGLIVCFDSIFEEASLLARDYGIDTLVFPHFWFDDMSPFKAVEFQQSWALANKVNLLGANIHFPGSGSLGSGIYSKDWGALVYTYDPDGLSKLLVAEISDKPTKGEIIAITEDQVYIKDERGDHFPGECYDKVMGPVKDNFTDYRCYKSQTEHYALKQLTDDVGHVSVCHNEFCCSLSYETYAMEDGYYLAVHKGTNDVYSYFYWCEEACMLVKCGSFEDKPCFTPLSISDTVFISLQMKAQFVDAEVIYATVSKSKERLAPKSEWNYETKGDETVLTFNSESQDPLLKAGMFGRCYKNDPPFVPYY